MFKALLTTLVATAIAGCSTTPVTSSRAISVPPERITAFQEKTTQATATLVVTRDEGYVGSLCYLAFSIDKVLAARFEVGETARFFVEPGEHLLTVIGDGKGMCGFGDSGTTRESLLRANETKYFRLLINGSADIQRSED